MNTSFIDHMIALRLAFMFVQKVTDTEAYKRKIVDSDGNQIKKDADLTSEDKEHYSYLNKVVFKIKTLVGSSKLYTLLPLLLVAHKTLSEEVEVDDISLESLSDNYDYVLSHYTPNDMKRLNEELSTSLGNVVTGAGTRGTDDSPFGGKSLMPIARRSGSYQDRNRKTKLKTFKDYINVHVNS